MTAPLFDRSLVPLRRARAEAMGADYFLHERAFDECLGRLAAVRRHFSTVLLLGEDRKGWAERLRAADFKTVVIAGNDWTAPLPEAPDLCLSIGDLDSADDLPALLGAVRFLLAPDGLFLGAFAGGNSLAALRTAMHAADRAAGSGAAAHVHPRIDPASFAGLLAAAGFVDPVVDVDRLSLRYASFDTLVRDLRRMASTNRLAERPRRPLLRTGLDAARRAFTALADHEGRTVETVDIVHFAAWSPATDLSRLTEN